MVKASQSVFLQLVLLGVIIFASAMIPNTLDYFNVGVETASAGCNAHVWLMALGMGVIFGALQANSIVSTR